MERGTCVTGDTLYDLFEQDRPRLQPFEEAERHGATFGEFILCYLSRPAALRSPDGIRSLLEGLQALHARQERPVLLVQHPSALACFQEREQQIPDGIRILPPLTHIAFLSLVCASTFVVTDSPALQREALYAGKRACCFLRYRPGRPPCRTAGISPAPLPQTWPPPEKPYSSPVRIRVCPGPAVRLPVGWRPPSWPSLPTSRTASLRGTAPPVHRMIDALSSATC